MINSLKSSVAAELLWTKHWDPAVNRMTSCMPSSADPVDDLTVGCSCLVAPLAAEWQQQRDWPNLPCQVRWADSKQCRGLITGSALWSGTIAHTSDLHYTPCYLDELCSKSANGVLKSTSNKLQHWCAPHYWWTMLNFFFCETTN